MAKKIDVAEIFGSDVFDDATMRENLQRIKTDNRRGRRA